MRAFIGIPIDKETSHKVSQSVIEYQKFYDRNCLNITPLANYHITLSFLGEINSLQLMRLEDQFTDFKGFVPFDIQLTMMSPFPLGYPKVIAVMIEPTEALLLLQKNVVSMVKNAGIAQKRTKFKPHLTVVRVKSKIELSPKECPLIDINHKLYVNQINLYESQLHKSGARYTPRLYCRW